MKLRGLAMAAFVGVVLLSSTLAGGLAPTPVDYAR